MPYGDDTMTCIRIERNMDMDAVTPGDVQDVYDRVLNPIFADNANLRDFFIKLYARIMAGHANKEDKLWIVMLGERNCGKSVLVDAFQEAFGDYVQRTTADHFLAKKGCGDAALDMKWAVNLDMARAVFTNEIKMSEEKECKLDGAMLKKIASGGDKIEARALYEQKVSVKLQCAFCLCLNDMPDVNVADAMETCHEFNLMSQFIDPKKRKPKPYKPGDIMKEYRADDGIKDYISSDRFVRAFTKIIFDAYSTAKPDIPEEIQATAKENTQDTDFEVFNRMFTFTDKKSDVVQISHFNYECKQKLSCSKKKWKLYLKRKGE
jgi:hypothetical protein